MRARAQLATVVLLALLATIVRVFSALRLSPPPPAEVAPPIECLLEPVPFRTAYVDVAARFAPCVRHWRAALRFPRGEWPGVPLDGLDMPVHAHPDDSLLLHRLWPLALGGTPPGAAVPCGSLVVGDDAAALTRCRRAAARRRARACAPTTGVAISGGARSPRPTPPAAATTTRRRRRGRVRAQPRDARAARCRSACTAPRTSSDASSGQARRAPTRAPTAARGCSSAARCARRTRARSRRRPAPRAGAEAAARASTSSTRAARRASTARVLAAVGFDCGVRRGGPRRPRTRALLEQVRAEPARHGGEPPYHVGRCCSARCRSSRGTRATSRCTRPPVVRVRDEEWASVTPVPARALDRDRARHGAGRVRPAQAVRAVLDGRAAASRWAPPARRGGLAALALVDREPPPNASLAGGVTWGA